MVVLALAGRTLFSKCGMMGPSVPQSENTVAFSNVRPMQLYLAILHCIPFGACNSWITWGRMDLWNNWIDGVRSVARLASVQSPTLAQVVRVNLILHLFYIKRSTLDKDFTVVTPISRRSNLNGSKNVRQQPNWSKAHIKLTLCPHCKKKHDSLGPLHSPSQLS